MLCSDSNFFITKINVILNQTVSLVSTLYKPYKMVELNIQYTTCNGVIRPIWMINEMRL